MSSAVNLYHLLTSQMASANGSYSGNQPVGPPPTSNERVISIQESNQPRDPSATTSGERWMRMAASSRRASDMAAVRRQFRGKVVCNLSCGDCGVLVCKRGMKAILLADTTVELFSTDSPPIGVQMVNDDYETRNCHCRIRDVACLNCGNLVGYHVTQPCTDCLGSCNNGHFWMFHMDQVISEDRMDGSGGKVLLWAHLPRESDEVRNEMRVYEAMCR
ncbi:Protein fam72a [Rhizoclosmatium hyalinum]|nr:Protein fam72a [Rhizoclosmatium hyalinum]